jgi:hypothetical protein
MTPILDMFMFALAPAADQFYQMFPVCMPPAGDTTINWDCVTAGLSSVDKNCAICTSGPSTTCNYPPAFVYDPSTQTGGSTQTGQTSTIVYPTVDSAGNQIHCPVTFYSGGA